MSVRCVALFRGINVGRAKRVAMADLRDLAEKLGYSDAKTLLNSGNLVFTARDPKNAAAAAARIEKAVASELGVESRVTVLTAAELAAIVKENPLREFEAEPSRFLIAVSRDPKGCAKLKGLLDEDWGRDRIALGKRVAYVGCATGILESRLNQAVGRALGDGVTARNWATMQKLAAMASESR
jgi:uncharacterized protein (DUF1697 family)